jgi:GMP synthase (glutamine-hydrolysing)
LRPEHVQVVKVFTGEAFPAPGDWACTVTTGEASKLIERAHWSEHCTGWVRNAMDAKLLLFSVCFGHRLFAHALGGRVDCLPDGQETGKQSIAVLAEASEDHVAFQDDFRARTTHEQCVTERRAGSLVLATSKRDLHQALRHGMRALSTQFHWQFSAEIMRAYISPKHAELVH